MSFLKCNYEDHEFSKIKSVCIDKNCQQTRWACLGCKIEYHKNHKLLNIQQFKEFIRLKNESFNKQVVSLNQCIKNITLLNEDNLERLSLNQLDEQLKYLITFSQTEPELIPNINQVIPIINSIQKNIECFKQNLTLVSAKSSGNLNIKTLDVPPQNSERKIHTSYQGRTIFRQNIMTDRISNVQELLLPSIQIPIKDLRFQDPINVQKIQVNNNRKSGVGNGKILCDPRLSENSCVQYGFIWEDGFNMGIGICSKSIIMKNFYKPILEQVGHGIYMINGKGNVYSHDDEAINNIKIDVSFNLNELIILKIDFPHNQIQWLNQQGKQFYSMKINFLDQMYVILDLLGKIKIIDL